MIIHSVCYNLAHSPIITPTTRLAETQIYDVRFPFHNANHLQEDRETNAWIVSLLAKLHDSRSVSLFPTCSSETTEYHSKFMAGLASNSCKPALVATFAGYLLARVSGSRFC